MNIPESLQTIAEISIAFAGFSGLVVALRRKAGPLTTVQKYRLQVLLALAFGAMFLSLLPELLDNFAVSEERTWRYASAALSLYSIIFVFWWLGRSRQLMRSVPEIFNWFALSRMTTGHILIVLLQLGIVFSLLGDKSSGAYIAGLIWYLIHAAQQFSRMLFVQPRASDASN
jgi:hypothetical protein